MKTYSFEWDGFAVSVSHHETCEISGFLHIEVHSQDRIPITETKYRSHFMHHKDLEEFEDAEDYIRQWLDAAATSKKWVKYREDSRQLDLF